MIWYPLRGPSRSRAKIAARTSPRPAFGPRAEPGGPGNHGSGSKPAKVPVVASCQTPAALRCALPELGPAVAESDRATLFESLRCALATIAAGSPAVILLDDLQWSDDATLELLADAYGGRRGECHRLAGELHAQLRFGRIEAIFQAGLHEFLTDVIERTTVLGSDVSAFYLMS